MILSFTYRFLAKVYGHPSKQKFITDSHIIN